MNLDQILEGLEPQLPRWLAAQRWFSTAAEPPASARIVRHEILRDATPRLLWTLIETDSGATYQVPIGLREVDQIGAVLLGHEHALIGTIPTDDGEIVVYDGLVDSTLGRVLFDVITDGAQHVKSVRPIGAEQSNTSLVFDNRLILKVFRRLYEGANPDLEVTQRLTEAGFKHVAPVFATWQRGEHDLAVCQPYLWDGTDGWALALASVRDFLGIDTTGGTSTAGAPGLRVDADDPAAAGGDFANEARRLGAVTAELHVALSESFPVDNFEPAGLVASLESSLDEVPESQRPGLEKIIGELRGLPPSVAGKATRIHGDYHLGQTLRSVSGWYIFDFEGEPARPLSERVRATSPLKDAAGMMRSFQYAAAVGLFEQMPVERAALRDMATAWETRNRRAFRDGYFGVHGISELLPADAESQEVLLAAFEVEKAIYELRYERAHRPDWVAIPEAALARLLG